MELLIKKGYDINVTGSRNGYTPLHDAATEIRDKDTLKRKKN
ncbi:MAG: hypothetical protein ACRCZH_08340 [Cetobacterium sp.]